MQIKARLRLNAWISLSVIVFIALSIAWSVAIFNKVDRDKALVIEMRKAAAERILLRDDYLLYREDRIKLQWLAKSEDLRRLLESAADRFTDARDRAILREAKMNFDLTYTIFLRVMAGDSQKKSTGARSLAYDEAEMRLISQVFQKAHALQESIDSLYVSTERADDEARNKAIFLIVLFILTGVITVVANSFQLVRIVAKRVAALKDGIGIIGSGNLDYRIDETGNDELTDLSRAGNEMAKRLKESYTSIDNLQREIVERMKAEQGLRESEQRWLTTLSSIGDAVIATDADGRVTFMNTTAECLTGWTLGEASQKQIKNVFNIINEHTRNEVENPVSRALREGTIVGLANHTLLIKKDGTEVPIDDSAAPIKDSEGMVYGVALIFRDITERKLAERVLIDHLKKLEEANKELESFTYSVSHDLKAPLRAIEGYSRMLIKKYGDHVVEDAKRMLSVIQNNTERMNVLIDDLLSFSRVLRANLSSVEIDMNNLANEVWHEIIEVNQERELEARFTNILPGFGDRTLIRQVLVNLLSNAVKFTKNRKPGIIEMNCYTEDSNIVYCLKDNGIGFNMAYYDKMFGVFQRLHGPEEYEGTGVGLAIVQRIIIRHGGRIWAEAEVDKGATFYFTLPLQ